MEILKVYEDDYIVIVSKPAFILIHPSYFARNIKGPTLVDLLREKYGPEISPVHRLDYKTTGLVLFSKEKCNASLFQTAIQEGKKTYLALVRGHLLGEGKVDTPVKSKDANVHKEALTYYKSLATTEVNIPVGPYEVSRYSFMELKPVTGRMHQLRIHMAKLNHPIIGDHKYGDRFHNKMFEEKLENTNMFLHAKALSIFHPFEKKQLEVNNELPSSMKEALLKIRL